MKETFRGYYRPTKNEFSELWEDCLFVFDANVLLNIYRYSKKTRGILIDILDKISDRIWVPYQVALEYQQRRLEVIGEQESAYEDIQEILDKNKKIIENELNAYAMHPFIKIADILEKVNKNFTEIKNELNTHKQNHPNMTDGDELRDTITQLFEGKVGPSYSPEKLGEIYKEGKKRYERHIPPGYEDKKKDGVREYGDLVLWFQIIEKAESTKKSIIFITDDRKEDWWLKFKGKTIGPRPELINEIFSCSKVNFYMYQTEHFMEYAWKFLNEKIDKNAIDEVRDVRKAAATLDWEKLREQEKVWKQLKEQATGLDELMKQTDYWKNLNNQTFKWEELRRGADFLRQLKFTVKNKRTEKELDELNKQEETENE